MLLPSGYVADHVELGYAVTSFRAQGLNTDTAHVLVDSTMARETLYVAMTRGRDTNVAYVAVDKSDPSHAGPHPGENDEVTGRSVLAGVLQHVGAELSAHETIAVEQESWGTIAQLAAEYETIAAAAQRDRWAALVRVAGLSAEQTVEVVESDAVGPLTDELRRAEANHHDLAVLLPRLVQARDFGDADDIAAVMRHRLAVATSHNGDSGRSRRASRLIAGLIPEATGKMSDEMRQALSERHVLMEEHTDAVLDRGLDNAAPWVNGLDTELSDARSRAAWRRSTRVIAAYRDRYGVTTVTPLGAAPESTAQKIDHARAKAAIRVMEKLDQQHRTETPVRAIETRRLRI